MNISYPVTFPFTDDQEVSAETLRDIIYNPSDPDGALSIINGNMDWRNIGSVGVSDTVIRKEHVQRGSLIQGWSVSGTANLDYRFNWFGDYSSEALSFDKDADVISAGRAIPGACKTFFVSSGRAADLVRISWNIMWTNDNGWINDPGDQDFATHIYLKIIEHGTASPDASDGQIREVNRTVSGTGGSRAHEGSRKNRYWSGHEVVPLGTGHYTAALYIIQDTEIPQGRVWARSMNVRRMALKAAG